MNTGSECVEYSAVKALEVSLKDDIADQEECIPPLATRLNKDEILPKPTLRAIKTLNNKDTYDKATKIVDSVLQNKSDPQFVYKFLNHLKDKEVGLGELAKRVETKIEELEAGGQKGVKKRKYDSCNNDSPTEEVDFSVCEEPFITEIERKKTQRKVPEEDPLYKKVQNFCAGVKYILHTVNDYEIKAVLSLMTAPLDQNGQPFTNQPLDLDLPNSIVLGMFGGFKCAMIQTKMGVLCRNEVETALEKIKNAKTIIAIGIAYAQPAKKIKFGDVLVSTHIVRVGNTKKQDGSTFPKEGTHPYELKNKELITVFTRDTEFLKPFKVVKDGDRQSKVHCGTVFSDRALVNDLKARDEILKIVPHAIGGEMEGHVLLDIRESHENIDVIIIKGAADNGDGTKNDKWQPIAALAAAQYTHDKLSSLADVTTSKIEVANLIEFQN